MNNNEESITGDPYMMKNGAFIGENIRRERKRRSFTMEDLAEHLGLSVSYIGLLERGERCPSLKSIYRLCDLFGVTPDILLLMHRSGKVSEKSAEARERGTAMLLLDGIPKKELRHVNSMLKTILKWIYKP